MMPSRVFREIDVPEQIGALLTGIAFQCPLGAYREECAIAEYRGLPIRERLAQLAALSPAQKRILYRRHLSCLQEQEGDDAG